MNLSPSLSLAAARAGIAVLMLAGAGTASAQYKIVGPDGQVTFTDKAPTAAEQRATGAARPGDDNGGGNTSMPYEVRQAVNRYPVTMYTQKGCSPCDQARQALKARGIPFNEYTIETSADIELLRQRFSADQLPVITIGGQTVKGYSPTDLNGYLDAAAYPKQARLTGYNWPAPTPLAPPSRVATPTTPPPTTGGGAKIELPPPSKNGIQF